MIVIDYPHSRNFLDLYVCFISVSGQSISLSLIVDTLLCVCMYFFMDNIQHMRLSNKIRSNHCCTVSHRLFATFDIVSLHCFPAWSKSSSLFPALIEGKDVNMYGTPASPPLFTSGTSGSSPRMGTPTSEAARLKASGEPYK